MDSVFAALDEGADFTAEALAALPADLTAEVFPIDPDLADTAALTEAYGLAPEHSANCVLVAGTDGFFELKRSRTRDPIFD